MNKDTSKHFKLIDEIIKKDITLIGKDRFECILTLKDRIDALDGDIIECGVYKGGMSIFLSDLFSEKKIWVADSFRGCQPLKNALYKYDKEERWKDHQFSVSLEEVKRNFAKFNLKNTDRITFLPGWVKDTLPTCEINKISLLRVDVDSYSATREVLVYLYEKVVTGGIIIFDDSCCYESLDAIRDFFKIEKSNDCNTIKFYDTSHTEIDLLNIKDPEVKCGCYMIKP